MIERLSSINVSQRGFELPPYERITEQEHPDRVAATGLMKVTV
jgi:hypothetical protein